MKLQFFSANQRGIKDRGWLKSNYFFSFSDFYYPTRSAFGTLNAFNDNFIAAGKGLGIHQHTNMEVIFILLKGKINYKDLLGYQTEMKASSVQVLSAGSGLTHEAFNIGEETANFLEIWIKPKIQNIAPRYQQYSFPKEDRKNKLVKIVSNEEGMQHCWINQNTHLLIGYYERPAVFTYTFHPVNKCVFIFSLEGSLRVQEQVLQERDAIGFWETGELSLQCAEKSEFLILETPINQQ